MVSSATIETGTMFTSHHQQVNGSGGGTDQKLIKHKRKKLDNQLKDTYSIYIE